MDGLPPCLSCDVIVHQNVSEISHFPHALYSSSLYISKAHTIEGDQILTGRFYANKKRPLGIIKESVDSAIE